MGSAALIAAGLTVATTTANATQIIYTLGNEFSGGKDVTGDPVATFDDGDSTGR